MRNNRRRRAELEEEGGKEKEKDAPRTFATSIQLAKFSTCTLILDMHPASLSLPVQAYRKASSSRLHLHLLQAENVK